MLPVRVRTDTITLQPYAKDYTIDTFNKVPSIIIPFKSPETEQIVKVPFVIMRPNKTGKKKPMGISMLKAFPSLLWGNLTHMATTDEGFIASWGMLELLDYKMVYALLNNIGHDIFEAPRTHIHYKRFSNGNARNSLTLRLPGNCKFYTSLENQIDPEKLMETANPANEIRGLVRIFGNKEVWAINSESLQLRGLFEKTEIERAVMESLRSSYPFLLGTNFRDFEILDF